MTRPADSRTAERNASWSGSRKTRAPVCPIKHDSTSALSQAALGQVMSRGHHAVAGTAAKDLAEQASPRARSNLRGQAAQAVVHDVGPLGSAELVVGRAEKQEGLAGVGTYPGGDTSAGRRR